jgi:transposase
MIGGMAKGYRRVDRDQEFLLPPSMRDWLPEDHLVWFVIEVVERLGTSAFHTRARLGGVGRRGFDPDMLLCLFVYAMAHGVRSSRQIERLCHTDVAFRIICAQDAPDHTVLARFRQDHEQAMQDLLTRTLVLAAELGMVRLGVVAFDGTKIAANAARDRNYTAGHLRKLAAEHLRAAAAADQAEDALFGEDRRGDELPDKLRDRTHRGRRISQALSEVQAREAAAAARAEAEAAADVEYVAKTADPAGRAPGGRPRRGADPVAVAKARYERELARARSHLTDYQARAAVAAARGHKLPGTPPGPPEEYYKVVRVHQAYQAALAVAAATKTKPQDAAATGAADAPTANLTDLDSRLLKTRNGWVQGYNCQTAVSEDGFIVYTRATQDGNDVHQFTATADGVSQIAGRLAAHVPDRAADLTIGTLIGDAGYDSQDNLDAPGPDRLIANAKHRDLSRRTATDPATKGEPPETATARQKMDHRLGTPDGRSLYKRRAPIVEPPNAWLKDRRGLRHGFSRRGLPAAHAELSFASAVTNLLKIATTGITAAQLAT